MAGLHKRCKGQVNRKLTWMEIKSWPEIHPDHEIKVLQMLLKDLEMKEDYETCAIVQRRIETLREL